MNLYFCASAILGSCQSVIVFRFGEQSFDLPQGHLTGVKCCAFSSDGERLVSGGGGIFERENGVKLKPKDANPKIEIITWNIQTSETAVTHSYDCMIEAISFSPDSSIIAACLGSFPARAMDQMGEMYMGDESGIALIDLDEGAENKTINKGGSPCDVEFLSHDTIVFTDGNGVWERNLLDAVKGRYASTEKEKYDVALCANQKKLAIASLDGISIFEVNRKQLLGTLPANGYRVEFSPTGTKLASAGGKGNQVRLWDVESFQELAVSPRQTDRISCIVFSPDGDKLLSGCHDGLVTVWSLPKLELTQVLRGHSAGVSSLAFSPDGLTLASSDYNGVIILWDGIQFSPKLTSDDRASTIFDLKFSPDGKMLAFAGFRGDVSIWDSRMRERRLPYIQADDKDKSVHDRPQINGE